MALLRPAASGATAGDRSSTLLLLTTGSLGIATQVALLRELMAAHGGNELSTGVTVAAWLLAEALGAWLAGHARSSLASAAPAEQRIVRRLSSLSALSVLSSLAAVPAATLVRPVLGALPGEVLSIPHLLLGTGIVVTLPAAAHGALFVTAAAHRRRGLGSAYVWEGIGTALAGFACYLLLNRLPSLAVVALSALPLIVAALVGSGRARTRWTMWTLGLVALASFVLARPIEQVTWGAAWHGQRVIAVANSPYGKTILLERSGQQLVVYDGLPVLSVPVTAGERVEELSLLPVLFHPSPRRVLVLGSDLAIPSAMARFRPDIAVTTVQIDPVLARISLTALFSDSLLITPRSPLITSHSDSSLLPPPFSLIIADPVSFLDATRDSFDCIILTEPGPSSLSSSRLFSAEFYERCRSRLGPAGILAAAGQGNPTGLSPDAVRLLATRRRTLEQAFGFVLPFAADFPLLLASERAPDVSAGTVMSRLSLLSEPAGVLDSSYVASLLDSFRQLAFSRQIADPRPLVAVRPSSASSPRELFLNMVRENRLTSPGFGAFYARLDTLSPRLLLLLGAVLLIAGVAGARVRGRGFSRGFAIITSGFAGAAVSSLLVFIWQGRFGSAFSGVSLLFAAFTVGTVLGGAVGSRLSSATHHSSFITHRFLISDLVLALSAVAAALLIQGGPAVLFLVANCLAGACLGFQFASAGFITHHSSLIASAAARRAGILTALDLVGGSLGGILTALVVVPILGIGAAALLAGAVKLTSALAQLVPPRR